MRKNKLLVSGTSFKENAISYAKEVQIEEFHVSNGWFERWNIGFNVSFKTISKEKAVTPEITSSWWGTHNDGKSPIKVYCALWENFTIKETADKDRCIFTPFSNFFGIYKAIEK